MVIKFASSSTWHDRFLVPIARELDKLGYKTEQIRGQDWIINNPDDYVILSYQEDMAKVKKAKAIFIMEHAVSVTKSFVVFPQCAKADYALVQGEIFSKWWAFCHPNVKQIKCGWSRIEKLYNMPNKRDWIIEKHNLNPKEPIILYCPTWDYSTKPILCGTFQEAFPILESLKMSNFLCHQHYSDFYRDCYQSPYIIQTDEIYNYLAGCDLLIGDNSSLLIEFTVRNKPIIQLNKWNGHLEAFRTGYADGYNLDKYKELFGILKLGQIVELNKTKISKAINFALSNPDFFYSNREYWKSMCFYNLGSSLQSTVNGIVNIINNV